MVGGDDGVCVLCFKFGGVELGSVSCSSIYMYMYMYMSVFSFGVVVLD